MALITCPECKSQISDSADACPKCGYILTEEIVHKMKEETEKKKKSDARSRFWSLLIAFAIFGALVLGCVMCVSSDVIDINKTPEKPIIQCDSIKEIELPIPLKNYYKPKVGYTVINDKRTRPGWERYVDVQLSGLTDIQDLRNLSIKLIKSNPNYFKIVIKYFLPGQDYEISFWASAFYNRDHDTRDVKNHWVKIHGISITEDAKLRVKPLPENVEIIGKWIDQQLCCRYTIFKRDNEVFIENMFMGESFDDELIEKPPHSGKSFYLTEEPDVYWYVSPEGQLSLRDETMSYRTAVQM